MAIEPVERGPYDHKYRVRLRIDGVEAFGWGSPNLNKADSSRSLVLVTVNGTQVPRESRRAFEHFNSILNNLDDRRMSAAKKAVVKIRRGQWPTGDAQIAVHKMGPVPAFQLDEPAIPAPYGDTAKVVLFPRKRESELQADTLDRTPFNDDMFRCLTAIDTQILLRSYLEDIFHHLQDISDKLRLAESMVRLKAIYEVQSQSILQKIEKYLTPSPQQWADYKRRCTKGAARQLDSTADQLCHWFESNWPIVLETIYITCAVNKIVSDFCKMVGLSFNRLALTVRKVDYKYPKVLETFRICYGLDIRPAAISPLCELCSEILRHYEDENIDGLVALRDQDGNEHPFLAFVTFLLLCRQELRRIFGVDRFRSDDALIFVSRRFASNFGSRAATAAAAAVFEITQGSSEITTFMGDAGDEFEPRIKAQIWLSDAVWVAIPEQDQSVGDNLKWIYLEPEHACVLRKPWLYLARSSDDLGKALEKMRTISDIPLSNTFYYDRAKLKQLFLDRSGAKVAIVEDGNNDLIVEAARAFRREREQNGHSRRRALLYGYLSFFSADDLRLLSFIIERFGRRPFTKREFAASYARHCYGRGRLEGNAREQHEKAALKHFNRTYHRAAKYKADFGEGSESLFHIDSPHSSPKYKLNLIRFAVKLGGGPKRIDDETAIDDVRACLNRCLDD